MIMIKVKGISKEFKVIEKRKGSIGHIKDIFSPHYNSVRALKNISFNIKQGEMVGLIGPNGAGKSTLIKILTGILYPNVGEIEVVGKIPWENRKKIAKDIGTVFGQKSQLWFHLDLIDSLNVLEAIYEIPHVNFKKNREFLIDTFNISELSTKPIRKLSLGERMKCEIVAALIHNPKLLFLDEPTIGLDLISKQIVRDVLIQINKIWGTTVVLTSHDTGDIDNICKRAIIINNGVKIIDDNLEHIKSQYIKEKNIRVRFKETICDELIVNGTNGLELIDDNTIMIKMDTRTYEENLSNVIYNVAKMGKIVDIFLEEMPLEEIIKNIYLKSM